MNLLVLSPLLILGFTAFLIWALNTRIRTYTIGILTLSSFLMALGSIGVAATLSATSFSFVWSTLDNTALVLRFETTGLPTLFAVMLLISGTITAGALTWTLGNSQRAFGLVFAGLLTLVLGGVLTAFSATPLGAFVGLGTAWLGGTIMQQTVTAHNRNASFSGLSILLLALTALIFGSLATFDGGSVRSGPWLLGCAILIGLAPRRGTTPTAPLLVRAPATALGLPILGGYLLVQHATLSAAVWSRQTTFAVLIVGVFGLILSAVNALAAKRLMDAFVWQLVAQLSFLVICFGTGQPAAGPMAAGLLAHTVITSISIALSIGQLERVLRSQDFAALPPLPRPLRRAGLAYGLAAASAAGIPPLLGYALRRVVLLLAPAQPWLGPVLLATSSLLALSYLPTMVAFFRRPAFRSPIAVVEQRGGGWPLLLMVGLLIGGLIPDGIWQSILGDTSVPRPGELWRWIRGDRSVAAPPLPSLQAAITSAISVIAAIAMFGIVNRALRHPRTNTEFAGGEPLDEEPGWTLPFVAFRALLWPLIVPDEPPGVHMWQWFQHQLGRLAQPLQALEQRYYLALVVVSLISVLLLAAQ